MDNLTHTLMGLAAGEVVARWTRAQPDGLAGQTRRAALLTVGMVGGNLPDADLLWSMQFATGDRLTYLVEHRGYTHTLVGCVALALLLLFGTLAALQWRGQRVRAPDVGLLAGMSLFAVLLHLGMDALNEYGVHPFWPWNNRWYYGDTLFIVEPLCWLALAPLYFTLQTRGARAFMGMVLAAGCIAVLTFHGFGLVWWCVPVVTLLLVLGGSCLSPRTASLATVGLLCAVTGVFSVAHAAVVRRVQALAAERFPGVTTLDLVLSPAPAHPFCWDVMMLQRSGDEYLARLGQLSLTAGSTSPEPSVSCARSIGGPTTVPLSAMRGPAAPGMHWLGEFSMGAEALARLATTNCDTRRLASFLRAPFAVETPEGWILGDIRYDREAGPGFAELVIDPHAPDRCGKSSPWIAPRRDLGFP